MQIGEGTTTGGGSADAQAEDEPQGVEAIRIEIYTQVLGSPEDEARRVSPFSTDSVRAWAVIWARPAGTREEPRPYCGPGLAFPDPSQHLFCVGRGGAHGGRVDRHLARPDLGSGFRPPRLEPLAAQHFPELPVRVEPWPSDWPAPSFEWTELEYTTTRTGADDPRTYRYTGDSSLSAESSNQGWTVAWTDGLTAGVHRLSVRATIEGNTIACPPTTRDRDAGFVTTVLVRDGSLVGPDEAVQARAATELPLALPAPMPEAIEYVRWASALLETPYERGGCWAGGSTLATASDPPLGYQGYGCDCTGLPSAGWTLAGLPEPSSWRFSTHKQHNPIPAVPLFDNFNDWTWTRRRWVQRAGAFHRFGPSILAFVQPGDFFDSGPGSELNHIRLVYAVVSRDFTRGDAQIRIIEASSSEAGKVRVDPSGTETMSLRDCLSMRRNAYGLWRPRAEHPTSDPFETPPPQPDSANP